jgi:SAM-dependent methyltransferase
MITHCPLCESDDLFVFLERTAVPVHQNRPMDSRAAARAVQRGDLRIACCRRCGFVTNTAFREELLQYGEGYENDQTCSPRFDEHVDGLVTRLLEAGVRSKFIVEVGCGRGYFLKRLCEQGDNRGVGFDPSYDGPDVLDGGRVRFVRNFYGPQHSNVQPDFVICRHVIEHVPSPLKLLGAVRAALEGNAHADLAFETPTVEWILDGLVVQDFFYEHCSYFSADSLAFAFRRAGFAPQSIGRIFGDQYLWIDAAYDSNARSFSEPHPVPPEDLLKLASRYRDFESRKTGELRARLQAMRLTGPIVVWGAGAKGVTFLHLLDPDGLLVDCVVDVNPRKHGKYVPGTGHVIVGVDELASRGIRHAVVMNSNYGEEIKTAVSAAGLDVAIHLEGDS